MCIRDSLQTHYSRNWGVPIRLKGRKGEGKEKEGIGMLKGEREGREGRGRTTCIPHYFRPWGEVMTTTVVETSNPPGSLNAAYSVIGGRWRFDNEVYCIRRGEVWPSVAALSAQAPVDKRIETRRQNYFAFDD